MRKSVNIESIKIEPDKIEPDKIEPDKIEPDKIEPDKIEPDKIEPDKIEPIKIEAILADPITTIKMKTNTFVTDNTITQILKRKVSKCNQISLESIFLFNVYIRYLCQNNIDVFVDLTTITRCHRFLLSGAQLYRKDADGNIPNKTEIDNLTIVVNKYFSKEKFSDRSDIFVDDENATSRPFDYISTVYFTNLIQHVEKNFKRYQNTYLIAKLTNILNGELSKKDINSIIYMIQNYVNKSISSEDELTGDNSAFKIDNRATKFNKIISKTDEIKRKIAEFIVSERHIVISTIGHEISREKIITVASNENILSYIKYFYFILGQLNKLIDTGFHLVPHFQLKIRHITFDCRSLCSIYEEWKDVKIGTTLFGANFNKYFDEMFQIRHMKKYKSLLVKYPIIRTFCTDGYTVSVHFEKEGRKINKTKGYGRKEEDGKKYENQTKPEVGKIDFEIAYHKWIKEQIGKKPLIFDAGDIYATEDFLIKTFNIGGGDPGNDVLENIEMRSGIHKSVNVQNENMLAYSRFER